MSYTTKIILLSVSSICVGYATYRYFFGQKKKIILPKDVVEMVYSDICDSTRRLFKYFLDAKEKYKSGGVLPKEFYTQITGEFRDLIKKSEESAVKSHGITLELFREGLYAHKNSPVIREIDLSFKIMEHIILDEEITEFKIPPQFTKAVILKLLSDLGSNSPEIVKLCCNEFEATEKLSVKKAMLPPRVDLCRPIYSKLLEKHINAFILSELTKLGVQLEDYKNAVKLYILQEQFLEDYTTLTYTNDLRFGEELELIMLEDVSIPDKLTKEYLLNLNEMLMSKLDKIYHDIITPFMSTINSDKDKVEVYRTLLGHEETFITFLRKIKEQTRRLKLEQLQDDGITSSQARHAELIYSRQDNSFATKLHDHDRNLVSTLRIKLQSEMKKKTI